MYQIQKKVIDESLILKPLPNFSGRAGSLLFIIMDGIGIGKKDEADAVHLASRQVPEYEKLIQTAVINAQLKAHGIAVGNPSDKDMGNSEIGHNALGAGRIFDQGAKLVKQSMEKGSLFKTELWSKLVKRNVLHFMGLLSDGNIHAHIDHLITMLKKAYADGAREAAVHILLDGRDVDEQSALKYIEQVENVLAEINKNDGFNYRIASGGGREKITMDRYEANWSWVERGWQIHVLAKADNLNQQKKLWKLYMPKILG